MQGPAPRTLRMRSLRRLQRRVDRTMASETVSSTRRGEIGTLSIELQRELSRLEEMPWPSGRVLVSLNDGRQLERRLLPLVRAARDERPDGHALHAIG
jgi:hypothetical protein